MIKLIELDIDLKIYSLWRNNKLELQGNEHGILIQNIIKLLRYRSTVPRVHKIKI